MNKIQKGYLGNPFLKQIGEQVSFTMEQVEEYARCSQDPVYFLENYGKIVSLDKGIISFKLFPYQKRIIDAILNNRKVIGKIGRQMGKSAIVAGYIAWYCLFNKNKTSAILANKMATAKEIFSRVQFIIENCPKWLQQGIKEWNKTSFILENDSRVFCSGTSPSAVRGQSINFLFLDEFAFLRPSLAEEFIASVFPTLSSAETSKMVIVSTPKGLNHYHKMWVEAEQGTNGFVTVDAHWSEHPARNQSWADGQLAELGQLKFNQEVLCSFIGSSQTLVDGAKVASLPILVGKELFSHYTEYFEPSKDTEGKHIGNYIVTVDVSRGADLDYSVATVIDISMIPYKVVARYRNNEVSTLVFPEIIYKIGKRFNDAFTLIETNDLGQQVADILFYDLEYENVYMSFREKIKEGGGNKKSPGIRTTKRSKAIGCDQLKTLIENDQLQVNDRDTISELSTFVRVGTSFKAEEGKHDDLAMTLVLFAYLTQELVFKDLFDFSLRTTFIKNQLQELEDSVSPIGFVDRGDIDETQGWSSPNGYVEVKNEFWDGWSNF